MGANIPGREVPDMRVTKILAVVATAAALVIAVPPVASASTSLDRGSASRDDAGKVPLCGMRSGLKRPSEVGTTSNSTVA